MDSHTKYAPLQLFIHKPKHSSQKEYTVVQTRVPNQDGTHDLIPPTSEIAFEVRRKPYILALPLMWFLILWVRAKKMLLGRKPTTNSLWFDGISSICRDIKDGAASWKALYLIYNHSFGVHGKATDFWLGMRTAQAVRNRKKLVTSLLAYHLSSFAREKTIRILSLASGSAQSVVEAMLTIKERGIRVEAILVDINPEALEHSRELAERYGLQDQVTLVKIDIRQLLQSDRSPLSSYGQFHVVEIVGWLEYDTDKRIKKLLTFIRSLMVQDGILVTSTINNNPERQFLRWVINWNMIHRDRKTLTMITNDAGFTEKNCEIVTEPHGIFHVAVCRK